jgi:glycosyltransferase involved in cell wall biosynthesis
MKPKVSVIMAVLNGECFIDEAIQSIVDQTYKNVELVVVDDGSTDRTRDRVDAFRDRLEIQYVRHETPRGIAPSMNDGVQSSKGASRRGGAVAVQVGRCFRNCSWTVSSSATAC